MIDYVLFGMFALTLLALARYHHFALPIAGFGLFCVLALRVLATDFDLVHHLHEEWRILVNLAGLLLGFAVLAAHFEHSHMPERVAQSLPSGRKGALLLLLLVALMSAVLDNIAAALIGGSTALTVFRRRVHVGYLAAIVACANAGGAGSVIGDTTTTMMWIEGASPLWLAKAAVGAVVAVLFISVFASGQQHRLQPLQRLDAPPPPVDGARLAIVGAILVGTIVTNVWLDFPAIGVWAAILLGTPFRAPDWKVLPGAAKGTLFLTSLVLTASMMPVQTLMPAPSVETAVGLGFVSSLFDNIPLTKLAIQKDHFDWGLLAYSVGYGGSMMWFGSSAGVAIAGVFHEAKSVAAWLKNGWHVIVGFVLGFAAMLLLFGWQPKALEKKTAPAPTTHGASEQPR